MKSGRRAGGQIIVNVFYILETCCLTATKSRQTSVWTSPHSWHWLHIPSQAVLSAQVGLLSKLHLKTHVPSPVQDTDHTVSASTNRASERGTTSQCNELQCIGRRPQTTQRRRRPLRIKDLLPNPSSIRCSGVVPTCTWQTALRGEWRAGRERLV